MKKLLTGILLLIFLLIFLLFSGQIQKYIYLRSYHFYNDMASLEFCIQDYYYSRNKFPSNFDNFLPSGEKLFPDGHPKEPDKNFYKLNFEFYNKDSLLIIYLYGFDNKDDHLSPNKYIKNLKWFDIFTFRGDIVVDTLRKAPAFLPSSQPPAPANMP